MSLSVVPFSLQLPSGYSLSASATPTQSATTTPSSTATTPSTSTNPVDVVSISTTWNAGTLTAAAGDVLSLSSLFQGQTGTSASVADYRVALGDGGGTLTLNGIDVTGQTSFTAAQFAQLTYTAGADGSAQNIVVAAQTGTQLANGTLTRIVDSPAVQITAAVSTDGDRSLNVMSALTTTPAGTDTATANVIGVVRQAGIFTGLGGSARPTLQTAGNFTAAAGDVLSLSSLFQGQTGTSASIADYRVALGDGGGTLTLNGVDVTGQTSFTAAQFAQLTYTAGANNSQQNIVVAAQTGTQLANGTLTRIVDSPAVQITAAVSTDGSRSLNAISALSTTSAVPDTATANVIDVVRQAGIFTGLGGSARPTLQTVLTPQLSLSAVALSAAVGAYYQAGIPAASTQTNLSSFDPTAVGSSSSSNTFTTTGGPLALALLVLDDTATGAFQSINKAIAQSQVVQAYVTS